jgi:4-hydroxybutyryl-CoA dehydratase/vinylacetyl-CoA-Delta-isomerase
LIQRHFVVSISVNRESLRRYTPRVFVDGRRVDSVADERAFQPGINAIALTYDYALEAGIRPLMTAVQHTSGKVVNRLLHIDMSSGDLLNKLEAVRLLCQETGCAQRYLAHDALNAMARSAPASTTRAAAPSTRARFANYLHRVQDQDLSLGIAMTDAKGDRSRAAPAGQRRHLRAHRRAQRQSGIVISGTKAIVTGAPYMHELLVMPSRNMGRTTPTLPSAAPCRSMRRASPSSPARPGGPARSWSMATRCFQPQIRPEHRGVLFDKVFVPWERVFYAGEWEHSRVLTYSYATHHRHSCIGARAGFGDLLIGAGALMCEANGFDPATKKAPARADGRAHHHHRRASSPAAWRPASTPTPDEHSGSFMPDPVFSQHRQAAAGHQDLRHAPPGARGVGRPDRRPARPGRRPQPGDRAKLSEVLRANPDVPYEQAHQWRASSKTSPPATRAAGTRVISLHGGGSPAAMKQEIWRNYPVGSKVELVERLLERGVQPGKCCDTGCTVPGAPVMVDLPTLEQTLPSRSEPGSTL